MSLRILILNQYLPPDPAPTSVLLGELAEHLRSVGYEVVGVSACAEYRTGQKQGGRMKREMLALGRMLYNGLRAPRADIVLSATSPPCLLVVATLIAWWHRALSVHWAMDLYPELAVGLGEIPRGFVSRMIAAVMGYCYDRTDVVVALDEDMAAHLRRTYDLEPPEVQRPWVFAPVLARLEEALGQPQPLGKPWTWVYSGNLGRAHEWETLLVAQQIIEERDGEIRLLFQGGGPSWPLAQARARELGLQRCEWRGYVEEAELPSKLLESAVCVATQKPEAHGLLWPSKLGLLLALPRRILWVGVKEGAIAEKLRGSKGAGIFAPGESEALAEWVLQARLQPEILTPVEEPASIRLQSLRTWDFCLLEWSLIFQEDHEKRERT